MNENPTKKTAPRKVAITCPKCEHTFKVLAVSVLGKISTPDKAAAAAKNGKHGGRPKAGSIKELRAKLAALKAEPKSKERDKHIAAIGRTIRRRKGAN